MKRIIDVLLPSLFVTTIAFAGSIFPDFHPTSVTVRVGETAVIDVWKGFSGFAPLYDTSPITLEFLSSDPSVATLARSSLGSGSFGRLTITGVAPGVATIRTRVLTGAPSIPIRPTITVVCGSEVPIVSPATVIQASGGEIVSLCVLSDAAARTTFVWYSGRLNDTSKPLQVGGVEYQLRATESQYVWVSALTACSTSAIEFHINVAPSRRRVAR